MKDEALFEADLALDPTTTASLRTFVGLVRRLRRDCPWDREQTHESLQNHFIEETYEAVEAIQNGNWTELRKELGDVLLQVVFHAVLGEEQGRFTLNEVVRGEINKLVVRHPHVFGDTAVSGTQEVLQNWERIKQQEPERTSVLDGIPQALPALFRAYRIQQKVAGVGFDFPSDGTADRDKVDEEIGEFYEALADGDAAHATEEFGDLLFSLTNVARRHGIDPEQALQVTNKKFSERFKAVEAQLKEQGKSPSTASLEEMDALWTASKQSR